MPLHWHRQDLRVADNRGLAAAATDGPAIPLFVFDDEILAHAGPPRVAFMLAALAALRRRYQQEGSDLLVRHGDPTTVVPDVAQEVGAQSVTWTAEVSGLGKERDAAVERALAAAGLEHETVSDALLHEPGSIRTNKGDVYSVFTYFWKKWRDRQKDPPVEPPTASDFAGIDDAEPLPSLTQLGFEEPEATIPPAGTEPARAALRSFCDGPIYRYGERREYPAAGCTSGLSPHLTFGTIGIREVYETVAAAEAAATGVAAESVQEFESQLAWREFYAHVLWDNPEVVTENFREYDKPVEWRNDPAGLQAWKDGMTGYPFVDAGMRQLRREAFVHNRLRMVVASFLTKDLMVDWRAGYAWFREKLVDHETGNDVGGWQWAASTGTDAQPYFRVFNPTTQGERYDPDAEYITEYVSELEAVPPDAIHEWPDLDADERNALAPDYPAPIVDHDARREEAIAMFERARGTD
jgi:deoxyribodipyrimidine photo-lyase